MGQVIYLNNQQRGNDLLELYYSICLDLEKECLSDVARLAKCSTSALRNWRDGKTQAPRTSTLMKVADVLGYRIEWTRL